MRGFHPWQAAYNRILLLGRLMDTNYSGWVCYMDADAYIADLDFNLEEYLFHKDDIALIATDSGIPNAPWWDINTGVFLINLGHPIARTIITSWNAVFSEITDDQLKSSPNLGLLPDDQDLLHALLRTIPNAAQSVLIDNASPRLLNYEEGHFIKQVLRAVGGFEERLHRLRGGVGRVLGPSDDVPIIMKSGMRSDIAAMQEAFVSALYRVLLLREPDPEGFANSLRELRSGMGFEDALRSCLMCDEFASTYKRILEMYVYRP
jgi:hypothetical protein